VGSGGGAAAPGPPRAEAMAALDLDVRIRRLLEEAGVPFREVHHARVATAEEAAAARGEPLAIGGKSLVLKVDDRFELFVVSAAVKLASREARRAAGARRSRFATEEELLALTGCAPGCVPPFGPPILPLALNAHRSVLGHARIAFTPGVHEASIVMATADWMRVARPRLFPGP
jgi:Ala-tRNA(Pro) deacylase